jgi:hypothetical protein
MSWSIAARRGVVALSIALLTLGTGPSGSAKPSGVEEGRDRVWMADLIREAESHGYAVAGSSPASARFIPTTPWAAYSLRGSNGGGE